MLELVLVAAEQSCGKRHSPVLARHVELTCARDRRQQPRTAYAGIIAKGDACFIGGHQTTAVSEHEHLPGQCRATHVVVEHSRDRPAECRDVRCNIQDVRPGALDKLFRIVSCASHQRVVEVVDWHRDGKRQRSRGAGAPADGGMRRQRRTLVGDVAIERQREVTIGVEADIAEPDVRDIRLIVNQRQSEVARHHADVAGPGHQGDRQPWMMLHERLRDRFVQLREGDHLVADTQGIRIPRARASGGEHHAEARERRTPCDAPVGHRPPLVVKLSMKRRCANRNATIKGSVVINVAAISGP